MVPQHRFCLRARIPVEQHLSAFQVTYCNHHDCTTQLPFRIRAQERGRTRNPPLQHCATHHRARQCRDSIPPLYHRVQHGWDGEAHFFRDLTASPKLRNMIGSMAIWQAAHKQTLRKRAMGGAPARLGPCVVGTKCVRSQYRAGATKQSRRVMEGTGSVGMAVTGTTAGSTTHLGYGKGLRPRSRVDGDKAIVPAKHNTKEDPC